MDRNKLKKLKREELLEIMLAQSEEIDRLQARVDELEAEVNDRRIKFRKVGSLAEASLAATKYFEEAEKAAALYLENIKRVADRFAAEEHAGSVSGSAGASGSAEDAPANGGISNDGAAVNEDEAENNNGAAANEGEGAAANEGETANNDDAANNGAADEADTEE